MDFNFTAPAAPALALRTEEILEDNDPTIICYGSEEFEIEASVRQGRTFGALIEQYAPLIGVTFDASKMTLRSEVVLENQPPTVSFDTVATSGVYILNSGSDSKGNSGFDY
jgi:hypothetical protein